MFSVMDSQGNIHQVDADEFYSDTIGTSLRKEGALVAFFSHVIYIKKDAA